MSKPGPFTADARAATGSPEGAVREGMSLLPLPGFLPDAVGFGTRVALALVIAYLVSFFLQLDSASSAGVCVAIVMQPYPGMALSKAAYRFGGTVIGGVVAVFITALFPQDRTMLLIAFTLWLALCTAVGSLLRDFRAYGAALAGYTVAIISVGGIDQPDSVLLLALDRVAAILVGILSVAVVNTLFTYSSGHEALVQGLEARLDEVTSVAVAALSGRSLCDDIHMAQLGGQVIAMRSLATYAAAELPDGGTRSAGSCLAVASMLTMISDSRMIAVTLHGPHAAELDTTTRAYLSEAAAGIGTGAPPRLPRNVPRGLLDAVAADRAAAVWNSHNLALTGMTALTAEHETATPPRVVFQTHYDFVGALNGAFRLILAVGLGSVFCVFAGWPGATTLLAYQAAFTALFGMQPHPAGLAVNAAVGLPFGAILAGVIAFLLLPDAGNYVGFAVAVGGGMFLLGMLGRSKLGEPYGPTVMLFFALLLSPSNMESFDLQTFLNGAMMIAVSVLFLMLAFRLLLPVSSSRRLFRLMAATVSGLRSALRDRNPSLSEPAQLSLTFDRLSLALLFVVKPYPARPATIRRIYAFSELDTAVRRAWSGLRAVEREDPAFAPIVAEARQHLAHANAPAMEALARQMFVQCGAGETVWRAAANLYQASLLLLNQTHALHRYGVLR